MGSYPSPPQPEVLPPVSDSAPPPRRRRPVWAAAPATHLLVGINCAVFLAMVARGASIWMPTTDQLMGWGANNAGNVLLGGEWWRIVTAMFVHVGILHLATNMWCLWNLGLLAEPLMGSFGLFAVYILTGAAGNLLSTLWNWSKFHDVWFRFHDPGSFPAGAGASGAVFGIAGALIVLLSSKQLPVPPEEVRKLRKSVIYFAVINLDHRLFCQLRQRVHRCRGRQFRARRRRPYADCSSRLRWCRASARREAIFSSSCG
jgi:rhomboid protease GluP